MFLFYFDARRVEKVIIFLEYFFSELKMLFSVFACKNTFKYSV